MSTVLQSRLRNFAAAQSGATLVIFAFLTPVLIGAMGLAIDLSVAYRDRSVVQTAADSAAEAAGRELSTGTRSQIANVASRLAQANMPPEWQGTATVKADVVDNNQSVQVTISKPWTGV